MSQVINLPKTATVTNSNKDVADELRQLADRIEKDEFGIVANTITILDSETGVRRHSIGGIGLNRCYVAGLLAYALDNLLHEQYE